MDESYLIEYTLREMDEVAGVAVGIDGLLVMTNGNGNENGKVSEEDVIMV